MRSAEEAAFARGVQVEALMDRAGAGIARAITNFFPHPGKCIAFTGKGHNAGDALVAAQCLRRLGWTIQVWLSFKEVDCSELVRKKLESLRRRPPRPKLIWAAVPQSSFSMVCLDWAPNHRCVILSAQPAVT